MKRLESTNNFVSKLTQSTRQSGKGNSYDNECSVHTRAIGTSKIKLVSLFSEGPDTAFVEPESFCISHMLGNEFLVGSASNSVERGMDFVTSSITFCAFFSNIDKIRADWILAVPRHEVDSIQIFRIERTQLVVGAADLDTGDATTASAAHLVTPAAPLVTILATISPTASVICRAIGWLPIQSWEILLVWRLLVSGLVIVLPAGISASVSSGCS